MIEIHTNLLNLRIQVLQHFEDVVVINIHSSFFLLVYGWRTATYIGFSSNSTLLNLSRMSRTIGQQRSKSSRSKHH